MARVFETEAVCDEPQAYLPSALRAELKCFEPPSPHGRAVL